MQLESNNEEPFRFLSEHFIIFENARDFVQIDDQKGWRMLLFCIEGCFQIEVNGTPYIILSNRTILHSARRIRWLPAR